MGSTFVEMLQKARAPYKSTKKARFNLACKCYAYPQHRDLASPSEVLMVSQSCPAASTSKMNSLKHVGRNKIQIISICPSCSYG